MRKRMEDIGFFRFAQSRKERRESQKALSRALEQADHLDDDKLASIVDAAARIDPLAHLIEETEKLIRSLGIRVPASGQECREIIIDRFFDGKPPDSPSMDAVKRMAVQFPQMVSDPVVASVQAYELLMAAKAARDDGEPGIAVRLLADGAWFLARGCTNAATAAAESVREKGAAARHAADPVQVAKCAAYEFWNERETGNHPRLRTEEQFAMEALRRWPVLTSAETVKKWSAQWRREKKRTC
jgi:hypothetical protein